ncbi:hypothetical protein NPIL_188591 [Nephila pilipes]|uniref:Uncharacterized protein n=1 Tax=Nephila pilipes TaxID=299642 RepID=A0A8X6PT77_NEPPI|nr:hypothetical protein NPIL_188591 [Nephila pilipes]
MVWSGRRAEVVRSSTPCHNGSESCLSVNTASLIRTTPDAPPGSTYKLIPLPAPFFTAKNPTVCVYPHEMYPIIPLHEEDAGCTHLPPFLPHDSCLKKIELDAAADNAFL